MTQTRSYDVIILGSGAAGLSLALRLPQYKIALISKGDLTAGSTVYAQGGIAAALNKQDSSAAHYQDSLNAGAGLCDEATVAFVTQEAPAAITWLTDQGVVFSTAPNSANQSQPYDLAQEGGHSHARIVHTDDATGYAITTALLAQIKKRSHIDILTHKTAIELAVRSKRCYGIYLLNQANNTVEFLAAPIIVLATGGASRVYPYTTNPPGASGDGIAMAWRAGCRIANLEFNQFHPTGLYPPKERVFLISEAVRGEGGQLKLPDGTRFMLSLDPQGELATRDKIARAIAMQMQKLACDHVYLDISHRPAAFIQQHFPTIYQHCLQQGIDITQQPIPVVPAAHYTCGGVVTNLHAQTDITGLYGLGEVAYTGLHGANRLASNSLLECIVFAKAASKAIQTQLTSLSLTGFPQADLLMPFAAVSLTSAQTQFLQQQKVQLLDLMWQKVGIIRSTLGLNQANETLAQLASALHTQFAPTVVNTQLLELRNLVTVAQLMVRCALQRQESRGLHYNVDLLTQDTHQAVPTVLTPPA